MLTEGQKSRIRESRELEESNWQEDTREVPMIGIGDGLLIKDSKWGDDYWVGTVRAIDKAWKYCCMVGQCGCKGNVLNPDEVNNYVKHRKDKVGMVVVNMRDMNEATKQRAFLDFQEAFSGEGTLVFDTSNYQVDPEVRRARIDFEKAEKLRKKRKKS